MKKEKRKRINSKKKRDILTKEVEKKEQEKKLINKIRHNNFFKKYTFINKNIFSQIKN